MLSHTDDDPIEACWNKVGVWGRTLPRCERLAEVSHCRNCLVYMRAGRQKLEERVPEHYRLDWVERWTQEEEAEEVADLRILVFRLYDAWFALPLSQLFEVLPMKTPALLPHRNPNVLRGLTHVRGELCLHISLSGLFGMPQLPLNEEAQHSFLLHVRACGQPLVFAVSEIFGMHQCCSEALQPMSDSLPPLQQQFSQGMCSVNTSQGIQHVCVLDTERWHKLGEYIR